MVILISGTTHTGKTLLSQKLMEEYNIPYFSIDHLKMGLIKSGQTLLTANADIQLTTYLWSIVKEMIKTVIENNQNIIIEGCYIPFDWKKDFSQKYLNEIKFYCLIMTAEYINNNFSDILNCENAIEKRLNSADVDLNDLIKDNENNFKLCEKYGLNYVLIDKNYDFKIKL